MAYPFAGFGSMLFPREEMPIFGTDMGWNRSPSLSRARPLGSATDSIVTLAIGSAVRTFELYLYPARFAQLQALVNTSAAFVDWERPTPDNRQAFLSKVEQVAWVASLCSDGTTEKKIRTRVELISQ